MANKQDKLEVLLDVEGLDEETFMREAMFDSVSPGICMNEDCDYTTQVEPDCRDGYCEECDTQTVVSGVELLL